MTKYLIVLPIVLLLELGGVSPSSAQTESDPTARLRDQFREQVRREVALDPRGAYLYAHSEVYRHRVESNVRALIGSIPANGARPSGVVQPQELVTPDVDLSRDPNDQNETTVAISRTNPELIIAGANDEGMYSLGMPVYRTQDGGKSWKLFRLPKLPFPHYLQGGDPIIAPDATGGFYYALLIYDLGGYYSNIAIAHSKDGSSWAYCTPVLPQRPTGSLEDKESIAVDRDPSSPHFGRIYVSWVHYVQTATTTDLTTDTRLAWSDDAGKTWTDPVSFEDFACEFPDLQVGKGGELLLAYCQPDTVTNSGGKHVLITSDDGGITLKKHVIAPYADYPIPSQTGYTTLKGLDGFRCFPYLNVVIDPMKGGRLHALYCSVENPGLDQTAGLFYSSSDDHGSTWTKPLTIRANLGGKLQDRFNPWLAIDEKTGEVFATFYTSEDDPANLLSRYVRVSITSHGAGNTVAMDTVAFDPSVVGTQTGSPPFIGDYSGCDAANGTFVAVWTESRPNNVDGEVFAYVSSASSAVKMQLPSFSSLWFGLPSVNPVSGSTTLNFYTPTAARATIDVFDVRGVVVRRALDRDLSQGEHTATIDMSDLPSGPYICRLVSQGRQAVTRLVKD